MKFVGEKELGCPIISVEKVRFSYTINYKHSPVCEADMMVTRLARLIISPALKCQKVLRLFISLDFHEDKN